MRRGNTSPHSTAAPAIDRRRRGYTSPSSPIPLTLQPYQKRGAGPVESSHTSFEVARAPINSSDESSPILAYSHAYRRPIDISLVSEERRVLASCCSPDEGVTIARRRRNAQVTTTPCSRHNPPPPTLPLPYSERA
ncbi:unnamed protein product, partial [Iphiclides podalirius]